MIVITRQKYKGMQKQCHDKFQGKVNDKHKYNGITDVNQINLPRD